MSSRARRTAIVVAVVALVAGGFGVGAGGAVSTSPRAPIAAALASVRAHIALLRSTVAPGTVAAALDALRGLRSAPPPSRRGATASSWSGAIGELADAVASARRDVAAHRSATVAALRIAAAIDRALPVLTHSTSVPALGGAADGCDVVDLTPTLCVGGSGDNVYTDDEQLLVDLGGHNVFHNAAGAATAAMPVSVNVSLGDDDTYDTTAVVAQGAAGGVGEIGVLVHLGQHASYRVVAPRSTKPAIVVAQGSSGAIGGIGLLVDNSPGGASFDVAAMSITAGGVVDGQGADGALVEVASSPTTYRLAVGGSSNLALIGQGSAAGLLVDGGGTDAFSAAAQQVQRAGSWSGSTVTVQGDGGSLLEGDGDTRYAVQSSVVGGSPPNGRAPVTTHVGAQGVSDDSPGIVDDLGGNDTFTVASMIAASGRIAAGNVDAQGIDHEVYAQGVGLTTTGLLADHGGATSYSVDAQTTWNVTPPTGNRRAMVTASYEPALLAQGVGYLGGTGILADDSGPDTMRVTSQAQTKVGRGQSRQVLVMTPGASIAYAQGVAELGVGVFIAPGARMVDATFGNDASGVSADAVLATPGRWPVVDGVLDETGPVHGTDAAALFVAGATQARVRASPSPIACSGDVGFGTWTGCTSSDDTAVPFLGSVGSAPVTLGSPSVVAFDSSTAGSARRDAASDVGNVLREYTPTTPSIGFAVSLVDARAAPIAGESIRVVLEGKPDGSTPSCGASRETWITWAPLWTTTVVTDRHGRAHGRLSLYLTSAFDARTTASPLAPLISGAGCGRYRLAAYYDGDPQRSAYPATATHALVLT